ncbi:F0F1 ATP synthase subunit gamma [Candidatus Profftella armatura (Diaphorina cf. continua)]|uniref:ATP synthase gamma chain n=1 Tax=Candidatus Profftella armatura (Diaphorina cf. continua) TaxID=2661583 RepID=A0A7R7ACN9_9PROT|nr:ATP synthase F1 subunit gamma [Candidatus Profftella armatura (Diaphorina cf. continua)]BCG49624.1 F0F1 ATP synthase subunit gamma [Candidatus Profftella armatura (Diaphorina cf. continua)]
MVTSKNIFNKIKSIKNTKKITKAMEMVSASKMRKTQNKMHEARPYSENIKRIICNLLRTHCEYKNLFLKKKNKIKRVAIILITTDKGLCGSINSNIFRILIKKINELENKGNFIDFFAIGQKGLNFLNEINIKTKLCITHIGDILYLNKLTNLIKILLKNYQNNLINSIYIIYTKFINTIQQKATIYKLLPFDYKHLIYSKKNNSKYSSYYTYETDIITLINKLFIRYIEALIYQLVSENIASEQVSRMMAMKSASENADYIIDELKLIYNKTRQATITKELSEIISGSSVI